MAKMTSTMTTNMTNTCTEKQHINTSKILRIFNMQMLLEFYNEGITVC